MKKSKALDNFWSHEISLQSFGGWSLINVCISCTCEQYKSLAKSDNKQQWGGKRINLSTGRNKHIYRQSSKGGLVSPLLLNKQRDFTRSRAAIARKLPQRRHFCTSPVEGVKVGKVYKVSTKAIALKIVIQMIPPLLSIYTLDCLVMDKSSI